MDSLQESPLSTADGRYAVELAREALDTYVTQDRRAQLGRQDDVFYARIGAFVQLRAAPRNQLRGNAGLYRGNDQLLDALVDATVKAAGDGKCGSSVRPSELKNIRLSLALVERVLVTDTPVDELEVGHHIPIVGETGWMFPTIPLEQGWGSEQVLTRTCRKAKYSPTAWQEGHTTLLQVRLFEEVTPYGSIVEVDPESFNSRDSGPTGAFSSYSG